MPPPPQLATDEVREEWNTYLRGDREASDVDDATTTDFLIGEAKYIVAQKLDAIILALSANYWWLKAEHPSPPSVRIHCTMDKGFTCEEQR